MVALVILAMIAPVLCYGQQAPTSVTVTGTTSTSISVEWAPVNGADNVGYRVTYTTSNGSCEPFRAGEVTTTGGRQTASVTLHMLHEYTSYDILVYAVDAFGQSNASQVVSSRTKRSVPVPPRITSVLSYPPFSNASQYMVNITWLPLNCSDINDEAIMAYDIKFRFEESPNQVDGIVHVLSPAQSTCVTNSQFRPWKIYHFQISAINSLGRSNFSAVYTLVLLGVPEAVTNVSVTLRSSPGCVHVQWILSDDVNTQVFLSGYEVSFEGTELFTIETRNTAVEVELPLSGVPYKVGVVTVLGHLKGKPVFANTLITLAPSTIKTTFPLITSTLRTVVTLPTFLPPKRQGSSLEAIVGVIIGILLSIFVIISITIIAICVYRRKFVSVDIANLN